MENQIFINAIKFATLRATKTITLTHQELNNRGILVVFRLCNTLIQNLLRRLNLEFYQPVGESF